MKRKPITKHESRTMFINRASNGGINKRSINERRENTSKMINKHIFNKSSNYRLSFHNVYIIHIDSGNQSVTNQVDITDSSGTNNLKIQLHSVTTSQPQINQSSTLLAPKKHHKA